MEKSLNFRFQIPKPPDGPLIQLSAQEAEKILLTKLDDAKDDPTDVLWQLAHFYKNSRQHDKALGVLRQLIQRSPDPEEKARCVFTMGQAMERVDDYAAAVRYYKEAFALEPAGTFTWYFIHNNLGFSLNKLGQFAEGETYCRCAIEIDPNRPNAFKNLGIALSGQGDNIRAARAFIAATQANAADARAFHLLETLLKDHPELEYEFQDDLDCCKKAVEAVAQKTAALRPVIHTGWRKNLILLQMKLQSALHRLLRILKSPS